MENKKQYELILNSTSLQEKDSLTHHERRIIEYQEKARILGIKFRRSEYSKGIEEHACR